MHLLVTEKHNAAQQIATILSDGAASTTRVKGQTIYTWGDNRCLGLAGHIVEVDFPEEYNDWEAILPSKPTSVDTETLAGSLFVSKSQCERSWLPADRREAGSGGWGGGGEPVVIIFGSHDYSVGDADISCRTNQ